MDPSRGPQAVFFVAGANGLSTNRGTGCPTTRASTLAVGAPVGATGPRSGGSTSHGIAGFRSLDHASGSSGFSRTLIKDRRVARRTKLATCTTVGRIDVGATGGSVGSLDATAAKDAGRTVAGPICPAADAVYRGVTADAGRGSPTGRTVLRLAGTCRPAGISSVAAGLYETDACKRRVITARTASRASRRPGAARIRPDGRPGVRKRSKVARGTAAKEGLAYRLA